MRRLLAGILVAAVLVLTGLQSAHAHDQAAPLDDCAVCAVAHQAQAEAPHAAPAVVRRVCCSAVAPLVASRVAAVSLPSTRARAPPSAA